MIKMNESDGKIASIMNSVSLALDTYDDIFSDFDTSPYEKRIISDDFTREIEKRYNENKKGEFEVLFSLPERLRSQKVEGIIRKRIKEHYKNKEKEVDERISKLKKIGKDRIIFGVILSIFEVLIRLKFLEAGLISEILAVLLIPAGWFSVWTGYEHFFDRPREFFERKDFYKRFEKAEYTFVSEETIALHISKAREEILKTEQKIEAKQESKSQEKKEEKK